MKSLDSAWRFAPITKKPAKQLHFCSWENLMLEIYENHQASMQAGAWDHLAIDVKDIEAAYEEICALGLNNQKDIIHFLPFWEHGVKFFKVLQDYRAELRSNRI